MEVFDRYAPYYDYFYREKNYAGEVDYVDALIKKYAVCETATILDLGCGTGEHAIMLAQKGYHITGVDCSEMMLAIAEEKKSQKGLPIELQKGDICTVDLHKRYDVAIAMFAVMGYQTKNERLECSLRNTWRHLNHDGLLIFDVWFGPAVLAQKPRNEILIVEKGSGSVIRLTRPNLDIISQIVDVNFTVLHVENDAILDRVEETHKMRFFFIQELECLLTKTGYQTIGMLPFMRLEGELTESDWNMTVIAKKAKR